MLGYLFLKADSAQAAAAVLNGDPLLLAIAALQLGFQIPLVAWRWSVVNASLGAPMPFGLALRYSWIGAFAGQVLPSVGGDAVRMWLCWTRYANPRIAVYGVTLERIVMVVALLALVAFSQPGLAARGVPLSVVGTATLLLACIGGATAALIFFGKELLKESRFLPIRALRHAALDVARLLGDIPRAALVFGLAFASYVNMAFVMWMIGLSLDLGPSLADCMILTPLVVLAAMLPVSVGGWGVRESAAILLFGFAGLSSPEALALSVVFGLCTLVVTLPGSVLWFVRERTGKPARGQPG